MFDETVGHLANRKDAMRKVKLVMVGAGLTIMAVGIGAWAFADHNSASLARSHVGQGAPAATRGAAAFEGGAFGGLSMTALESHALPWRLTTAALVLDKVDRTPGAEISQQTLDTVLARFGFMVGASAINRPPELEARDDTLPIGFTHGDLAPFGGSRLRAANLGCAACHAGVTYDELGQPQPERVWLGMPNTSINLEAYVQAVYAAMRNHIAEPDRLISTAGELHPDMEWRESLTLRWVVLPIVERRIAALEQAGRPLPFPNGVPGSTNGVAALKHDFGVPLLGGGVGDNGIVSIPELGHRAWRTSLLADGAYAPPGTERQRPMDKASVTAEHLRSLADITTFFTVPSMGVDPDEAPAYREGARAVFAFFSEDYEPQPFPGPFDTASARRGMSAYDATCAQCHGSYEWTGERPQLVEFPNWQGNVGTDSLRANAFTPELAAAIGDTSYGNTIAARATGQYAAPPLTGIWASAPYLHNGSVPTIDALLSSESRLGRYQIGGHALDYAKLGIALDDDGAYLSDHVPFSQPVWFDTTIAGHGNQGHTFGSDLDDDAKRDLIEFLKLI